MKNRSLNPLKSHFILLLTFSLAVSCLGQKSKNKTVKTSEGGEYIGTASVTEGLAKTIAENLYVCDRGRKTDVGEITSTDGKRWTVPSKTFYTDTTFPFAMDLFNSCEGNNYKNADEALANLKDSDIVVIDEEGTLFTTYIFADNYFEMYVNGVAVGKDKVPFTEFNASVVRFKVKRPFTIAMKLVDWEEHLGIGCEANRGQAFHAGDGGMVAVVKDGQGQIVAKTDQHWKAQTFYTAPIRDLSCVSEEGNYRYSKNCDTDGVTDAATTFALHWEIPAKWMDAHFDDGQWPDATTYTNQVIGVDNKPAYTNFTSIFDDRKQDAQFIWSTNVVLDNEVIVRYTVK